LRCWGKHWAKACVSVADCRRLPNKLRLVDQLIASQLTQCASGRQAGGQAAFRVCRCRQPRSLYGRAADARTLLTNHQRERVHCTAQRESICIMCASKITGYNGCIQRRPVDGSATCPLGSAQTQVHLLSRSARWWQCHWHVLIEFNIRRRPPRLCSAAGRMLHLKAP